MDVTNHTQTLPMNKEKRNTLQLAIGGQNNPDTEP